MPQDATRFNMHITVLRLNAAVSEFCRDKTKDEVWLPFCQHQGQGET